MKLSGVPLFFGFFERDHLNQEQAKVERDMQLAQQDSGGGKSSWPWRWKIPEFSRGFFMGQRSSFKHWTWSHKILEKIMYFYDFLCIFSKMFSFQPCNFWLSEGFCCMIWYTVIPPKMGNSAAIYHYVSESWGFHELVLFWSCCTSYHMTPYYTNSYMV